LADVYKQTELEIPNLHKALNVACYFKVTPYTMTNEEILQAVRQVEGLGGMTVNERLWVSGLMDEFDKSKIHDKVKAAYILELLQVDKPSIDKILY
jgi:hypothetical protein